MISMTECNDSATYRSYKSIACQMSSASATSIGFVLEVEVTQNVLSQTEGRCLNAPCTVHSCMRG